MVLIQLIIIYFFRHFIFLFQFTPSGAVGIVVMEYTKHASESVSALGTIVSTILHHSPRLDRALVRNVTVKCADR